MRSDLPQWESRFVRTPQTNGSGTAAAPSGVAQQGARPRDVFAAQAGQAPSPLTPQQAAYKAASLQDAIAQGIAVDVSRILSSIAPKDMGTLRAEFRTRSGIDLVTALEDKFSDDSSASALGNAPAQPWLPGLVKLASRGL